MSARVASASDLTIRDPKAYDEYQHNYYGGVASRKAALRKALKAERKRKGEGPTVATRTTHKLAMADGSEVLMSADVLGPKSEEAKAIVRPNRKRQKATDGRKRKSQKVHAYDAAELTEDLRALLPKLGTLNY